MNLLTSAMLIVVGVIHVLPLSGILGADWLAQLYGLPFNDPNLTVLMRHRAVLFGLLGVFFLFAAFSTPAQTLAFVAGSVSVVSFLWLAWPVSQYNPQIGRVFAADVVALACLVVGVIAHLFKPG